MIGVVIGTPFTFVNLYFAHFIKHQLQSITFLIEGMVSLMSDKHSSTLLSPKGSIPSFNCVAILGIVI